MLRTGLFRTAIRRQTTLVSRASAPFWVTHLNDALSRAPAATVTAFVALDAGSIFALFAAYSALGVTVPADFTAAFAVSRLLRRFRFPVDAAVAAGLARLHPPLTLVRVDALMGGSGSGGGSGSAAAAGTSMWSRASQAVRGTLERYGLAYFVASRCVVSVASVSSIFLALRTGVSIFGVDVTSAMAALESAVPGALGGSVVAGAGAWAAAAVTAGPAFPLILYCAATVGRATAGLPPAEVQSVVSSPSAVPALTVTHEPSRFFIRVADTEATLFYSLTDGDAMDIRSVVVPPAARGAGTASVLVEAALAWADGQGRTRVFATCEYVHASWAPKRAHRLGWSYDAQTRTLRKK